MAVTILETLQNAKINLIENGNTQIGRMIGQGQLVNAITLLEKGYSIDELVDPLLQEYGDVNHVPNKK